MAAMASRTPVADLSRVVTHRCKAVVAARKRLVKDACYNRKDTIMSVRNVGGHGVSSQAGHHNQQATAAQPSFQPGAGMTDSQRKPSGTVNAYSHGSTSQKKYPPAS